MMNEQDLIKKLGSVLEKANNHSERIMGFEFSAVIPEIRDVLCDYKDYMKDKITIRVVVEDSEDEFKKKVVDITNIPDETSPDPEAPENRIPEDTPILKSIEVEDEEKETIFDYVTKWLKCQYRNEHTCCFDNANRVLCSFVDCPRRKENGKS